MFTIEQLGKCEYPSPLEPRLSPDAFIPQDGTVELPGSRQMLQLAGPRRQLYFDGPTTSAAIVTCGGVSPGINNVIRSLFNELHFNYNVGKIFGFRHGLLGLTPAGEVPILLNLDIIDDIHNRGGSFLGMSRGPQSMVVMCDTLARMNVQIVFIVGGDGSQRAGHALHMEAVRRGQKLAVVGVPKTIDNDILFTDPSFGHTTAIEEATKAVYAAHSEATSAQRGIGIVKVMGRHAGFIAAGATVASQVATFTLVPEVPFPLTGETGLFAGLAQRLNERNHCIIIVAEGAGQHLFTVKTAGSDASGNVRPEDIGVFLSEEITRHFRELGEPVTVKYIDPSYMIRSVKANTTDQILCDAMARNAAHAAMAGLSDIISSRVFNVDVLVPIPAAIAKTKQMDVLSPLWSSVLLSTGQPNWPPAAESPKSKPTGDY